MSQIDTPKPLRIMLDFETLGLAPSSHVLSLGACTFPGELPKQEVFYTEFSKEQPGRTVDISTIEFWFAQEIKPPIAGGVSLASGVRDFVMWCKFNLERLGTDRLELWCNGTDFDIPVLNDITNCTSYPLTLPWKYSDVRDYRTLRKLFPEVVPAERTTQLHHALEDAIYQAQHCVEILHYLESIRHGYAVSGVGP